MFPGVSVQKKVASSREAKKIEKEQHLDSSLTVPQLRGEVKREANLKPNVQ